MFDQVTQENYGFLIKNPSSLKQQPAALDVFKKIEAKGLKKIDVFKKSGDEDLASSSEYNFLMKVSKDEKSGYKKYESITTFWINLCKDEKIPFYADDLKKHMDDLNEENTIKPESFEEFWNAQTDLSEGQVLIKDIEKKLKIRLGTLLNQSNKINKITQEYYVTPYCIGHNFRVFNWDYNTDEIKDSNIQKDMAEFSGIIDKLVEIVNGPPHLPERQKYHFFEGSEEKILLKTKASEIFNKLNKENINIFVEPIWSGFDAFFNKAPIQFNYVPLKELDIIVLNGSPSESKNITPSFRLTSNIRLLTNFNIKFSFGSKMKYEPKYTNFFKTFDRKLDEHLTEQINELVLKINQPVNVKPINNVKFISNKIPTK